jgi:hypothetical protein
VIAAISLASHEAEGELHLAHLFSDFVRVDLGDDRARAATSLAGLGMERNQSAL